MSYRTFVMSDNIKWAPVDEDTLEAVLEDIGFVARDAWDNLNGIDECVDALADVEILISEIYAPEDRPALKHRKPEHEDAGTVANALEYLLDSMRIIAKETEGIEQLYDICKLAMDIGLDAEQIQREYAKLAQEDYEAELRMMDAEYWASQF